MKIYLAGPEVFLPDAVQIGQAKKRLCAAYGFEGSIRSTMKSSQVRPANEPTG